MIHSETDLLTSVPFGKTSECVSNPKYYWDCSCRGKEPFVILQWTLDGEGIFEWNGTKSIVPKGNAFIAIIPEESKYYYPRHARSVWKFAWLNFYGSLSVALCRRLRDHFGPVIPLPESPAGSMATRLAEQARTHRFADAYEASAEAYAFLMEWLRQLTEPLLQRSDPVQVAVSRCTTHFRERFGVKELAAQTGLTREHFTRIFTEQMGKSPASYLRDLRVIAARQMLLRPNVLLKEVALRCGFPSVRSLRRALDAVPVEDGSGELADG